MCIYNGEKMRKMNLTLTAAAFAALALTGCNAVVQEKMAPNTLAAVKATAVNPAALAADPVWAKAQALNVEVSDGANFGGTYGIKKGTEVPFVDNFKAGDEVASFFMNGLKGDRADVKIVETWSSGVRTAVVSRKLVTRSKFDVQFADLKAKYGFGFAAFDNAQVRHATGDDPLYLVFK